MTVEKRKIFVARANFNDCDIRPYQSRSPLIPLRSLMDPIPATYRHIQEPLHWPSRPIRQTLPTSKNSLPQGSRSGGRSNTNYKHPYLLGFTICFVYSVLSSNFLCPTSILLRVFPNYKEFGLQATKVSCLHRSDFGAHPTSRLPCAIYIQLITGCHFDVMHVSN